MTTFSELPLCSALQRKLAAAQFINLTPIQERAIPPALEGRDLIGTAALNVCGTCSKPESEHKKANHNYERNDGSQK